jgi:hypothetical protein
MRTLVSRGLNLFFLGLGVLFINLTGLNVKAQSLVPLEKMVEASDRIVVGKVLGLESKWDKNGTLIWTYVTLSCQQIIKGPVSENQITIRVMGGKVGEVGVHVSHVPIFRKGETALVFLQENEKGLFDVLNWREGKYTFAQDGLERMGRREPFSLLNSIKKMVSQ